MVRKIHLFAVLGVLCALPLSSGYASDTSDDVHAAVKAAAETEDAEGNSFNYDPSINLTINFRNTPENAVPAKDTEVSAAITEDDPKGVLETNNDNAPADDNSGPEKITAAVSGGAPDHPPSSLDTPADNTSINTAADSHDAASDATTASAAPEEKENALAKSAPDTNDHTAKANPDSQTGAKSEASATARVTPIQSDTTQVIVDNGPKGESVRVGLISWRDLPFQTVKHQAFDYSCGSAAVATLMTYAYNVPTSEKEVFEEMFKEGDQVKIQHEGFSMLDMSRYLNHHGLEAQGYMITMHVIEKYEMPIIALVNNKGYNHFVVVKTTNGGRVLVGDPNTGNTEYSKEDFAKIWNGIAIVVTNEASKARTAFNNRNEWRFARAHVELRNGNDIGNETAELAPLSWQIAPTGPSILPAFTIGAAVAINGGGS